jgi:hypothetical protein
VSASLARCRQTIFANPGDPDAPLGNCLQAAIASMLGIPLGEVPHFVQIDADGGLPFGVVLREFLGSRGLRLVVDVDPAPGEEYLAIGRSPRGQGLYHCAIYRDGELVHDPHPDDTGVAEATIRWVLRRAGGGER